MQNIGVKTTNEKIYVRKNHLQKVAGNNDPNLVWSVMKSLSGKKMIQTSRMLTDRDRGNALDKTKVFNAACTMVSRWENDKSSMKGVGEVHWYIIGLLGFLLLSLEAAFIITDRQHMLKQMVPGRLQVVDCTALFLL